jgi:hypothetical protein
LSARGAFQQGKTNHPTIAKYFHEQKYWQRLGIHTDTRSLEERPWKEVWEYDIIMEEQHHAEQPKPNRNVRGGAR